VCVRACVHVVTCCECVSAASPVVVWQT